MLSKSVNPIILANFAIPFGEKSERSGKALAFFRGWTEIAKYRTKPIERRIYALLFCLLHYATGVAVSYAYRLNREGIYSYFPIGFKAFGDAWSNIGEAMKPSLFLCPKN